MTGRPSTPADKARRRRSLAIAMGLVAFVALVFVVTMVRLAQNASKGPGTIVGSVSAPLAHG